MQLGLSIPRFILGVALLVLAVIPTVKQSIEIYKVIKMWRPNKNMQQLTRDGILYFLVYVMFSLSSAHVDTITIAQLLGSCFTTSMM